MPGECILRFLVVQSVAFHPLLLGIALSSTVRLRPPGVTIDRWCHEVVPWNYPEQYGGIATPNRGSAGRLFKGLEIALSSMVGLRLEDLPVVGRVGAAWNSSEQYAGIATMRFAFF